MMGLQSLIGSDGEPLSGERADLVRAAYKALAALTPGERGLVTCWFCRGCGIYVGPGQSCHCESDE